MGKLRGLEYFKMGAVGAGKTMGTVLTAVTGIKEGSFKIDNGKAEIIEQEYEDTDINYAFTKKNGSKKITFTSDEFTAQLLVRFMGGTITTTGIGAAIVDKWNAPDIAPEIYQSIEFKDRDLKAVVQFPYAKVTASLTTDVTKGATSMLEVEIIPLSTMTAAIPNPA